MRSLRTYLATLLMLVSFGACFSQKQVPTENTKDNRSRIDSAISRIMEDSKKLSVRYDSLSREMREVQKGLDKSIAYNAEINTTADRVISWSGHILTIGGIVLTLIAIYTAIEVAKIRELRKECEDLLNDAKSKVDARVDDFDRSLVQLDVDKEKALQLLFPLVEGKVNFTNGNYDRAFELYKEADSIEPDHPRIIKPLYWLYTNTGHIKEAIIKLERLNKLRPGNRETTNRLAEAYRRNKDYDSAIKVVEELAIENKYPPSLYEYAAIMQGKGSFAEAEDYYKAARKQYMMESDEKRHWVYLSIALMQFVNKKHSESLSSANDTIEICRETLLRKPDNSHCQLSLSMAKVLINVNDFGAEYTLRKAIRNKLPYGLAVSAIDKLVLIEGISPSTVVRSMRTKLEVYTTGLTTI